MHLTRLARLFLWNQIRGEIFLTFLSIAGIALGIGLFVGVKAATDRALVSFEESIQGIHPDVNFEIVDSAGIDFDELIYPQIRRTEEKSYPVLQTHGFLPDLKASIDLTGIHTVKMTRFLLAGEKEPFDVEDFFRERNGILVTKKFSGKYGLKKGDTVIAFVYDGKYPLKIVDTLNNSGLPSNIALMDLGNFQEYFDRHGVLTRIDLSMPDSAAEAILNRLPQNLSLESKSEVVRQQQALIASFRYNLQFITFLAVLVGIFLLYNTIFISVVKRRTEIGILRGMGTDRKTIVILFTLTGLILGFTGSVLGIAIGQVFSYFSIYAVEKTISSVYRGISISDSLITWRDALEAMGLGCFVSLLASLIPALESAKVQPSESSKAGTFERRHKNHQKQFSVPGLFCILAGGVISFLDYLYVPTEFPYLAYSGILLFILGFTLNAAGFLGLILKIVRRPAYSFFPTTGKIAINDIDGSRYRFSVAVMSVAVSSALIFAILASIFSLKESFREWLDVYLVADIYVKPASCTSNLCFTPLSAGLIEQIKTYPEVRDIGRYRALQLDFMGRKVTAGFGETEIWRKFSNRNHPESSYLESADQGNVISISEYLKVKYGFNLGDEVELQTPKGKKKFVIDDTSISYSTTSGFIYLDRKWLEELWDLDDTTQLTIYLKEGYDTGPFIERLNRDLQNGYSLTIVDSRELRKESLEIFDSSFAVTYAIELIAIVISLIGVINTLLILVFERKREISILRYLGGGWDQIRNIMVLSAGIVGIAGIVYGAMLGPAISMVIIHVINKISFGWEVSLNTPYGYLAFLIVTLFLAIIAAGILPAKVAQRIDPKKYISFE
jgi:putative ABC transport system permease protein